MALHQFGVINPTASNDLILYGPGETTFRIFLDVAGHVCVAPTANCNIQGRTGTPRISKRRAKAHRLDEVLSCYRVLNSILRFSPPHVVAISLYLLRKRSINHGRNPIRLKGAPSG